MNMSNDFFAKRLAAIDEAKAWRLPAIESEETAPAQTRVDQLNRVIRLIVDCIMKMRLTGPSRQGNCYLVACRGRRTGSVNVDGKTQSGKQKDCRPMNRCYFDLLRCHSSLVRIVSVKSRLGSVIRCSRLTPRRTSARVAPWPRPSFRAARPAYSRR
jgi:hypothetical protein